MRKACRQASSRTQVQTTLRSPNARKNAASVRGARSSRKCICAHRIASNRPRTKDKKSPWMLLGFCREHSGEILSNLPASPDVLRILIDDSRVVNGMFLSAGPVIGLSELNTVTDNPPCNCCIQKRARLRAERRGLSRSRGEILSLLRCDFQLEANRGCSVAIKIFSSPRFRKLTICRADCTARQSNDCHCHAANDR